MEVHFDTAARPEGRIGRSRRENYKSSVKVKMLTKCEMQRHQRKRRGLFSIHRSIQLRVSESYRVSSEKTR